MNMYDQFRTPHPMIPQTAQASACTKPNHTHGKCDAVAFANAFESLSQAQAVSWPVALSNTFCEVKCGYASGKVTGLCGYLFVRAPFERKLY
jgi:hypothetical protein